MDIDSRFNGMSQEVIARRRNGNATTVRVPIALLTVVFIAGAWTGVNAIISYRQATTFRERQQAAMRAFLERIERGMGPSGERARDPAFQTESAAILLSIGEQADTMEDEELRVYYGRVLRDFLDKASTDGHP